MRPSRPLLAGLLAASMLLTGCAQDDEPRGGSTPSDAASSGSDPKQGCTQVRRTLLGEVQAYVDLYGPALSKGEAREGGTVGTDDTGLREALVEAQTDLRAAGCDPEEFGEAFARDLEGVTARGPLARAVLLRLTASLTGELGRTASRVRLGPDDDLARELSRLAPGSTARLAPGRYTLDAPLVLLSGVTVRGAGKDRTTVRSTAAGSVVLVLNGERTELRDLTLRHAGRRAASVVTGGPSSYVVLTDARVAGARGSGRDTAAGTGSGVSMSARPEEERDRGTTLEMTRTELVDNTAGGVLLAGAHRASIRRSELRGNGQCGVCFTGVSSGAVRSTAFVDNTVGVAVLGEAAPGIVSSSFEGGEVGVQSSGSATPLVRDVEIVGTSRAAMIFGDSSRGRVERASCERTPFGIVVTPGALPFLGTNDCEVAATGE